MESFRLHPHSRPSIAIGLEKGVTEPEARRIASKYDVRDWRGNRCSFEYVPEQEHTKPLLIFRSPMTRKAR